MDKMFYKCESLSVLTINTLDTSSLVEMNEMFYGVSWKGVTIDSFIHELDQYIQWYANDRIKLSLGGMSPMDYRKSLGLLTP